MIRVFSAAGTHPFDQLEWEKRTAEITDGQARIASASWYGTSRKASSFWKSLATYWLP